MSYDQRPGKDEIVVHVTSEPDNVGRVRFTAYWHNPKIPSEGGPTDRIRSQEHNTNLPVFESAVERRGATVRVIDHEPVWEPPGQAIRPTDRRSTVKGILIPADPAKPVRQVDVAGRDHVAELIGGVAEPTQYDRDAVMYADDSVWSGRKAMNGRATDYIKQHSDVAKQGGMKDVEADYGLYGDVVAVGFAAEAGFRNVPEQLVEHFKPEQLPRLDVPKFDAPKQSVDGLGMRHR